MPYLWTPELRQDFHEALETLHAETKTPSLEASYNESLIAVDPKNYTLRIRDELQLANHIAFLAHSQEGVEAISGACVEEVGDGLTIRLASNHTPSPGTVSELRNILSTMSRGATQGQFVPGLRDIPQAEFCRHEQKNSSRPNILRRLKSKPGADFTTHTAALDSSSELFSRHRGAATKSNNTILPSFKG